VILVSPLNLEGEGLGAFLATALSLPTVLFSVPVLLSVVYWIFVVIGAADLDALDALDGADGALEGAGDGTLDLLNSADANALTGIDGALDGLDGPLDGFGDEALEALQEAGHPVDHESSGLLPVLMSTLKLTTVPLTVSLSFIALFSWLASFLLTVHVTPMLPLSELLSSLVVAGTALTFGTLSASAAVRPLGGVFHTEHGRGNRSFIGSVVTVTTGKVTDRFGQAELSERDHHLIVQVRDRGSQSLGKGDQALLVRWDPEEEVFVAEKLDLSATDGDVRAARQQAIDTLRRQASDRKKSTKTTQ